MRQVGMEDNPRRDPAPSRWAFRVQRLWLTPLFRALLRVGVPAFGLVLVLGWAVTDPQVKQMAADAYDDVRRSVAERPEFMVKLMAIDGASDELGDEIRQAVPIDFPISSFDLDLEDMRRAVEGVDAVASADLRIRPGGVLQVEVTERVPAIVWRTGNVLALLDGTGNFVAPLDRRSMRADLPLVVGQGAAETVEEALQLFDAAAPLEARIRGLVRMGERRWDLVLDRDQRILLPETGAYGALQEVLALAQARDLLARDLVAIDMRNPARPTLRMAPPAQEEMRRIKALEYGEDF